jgi:GxxExxY protein
MNSAVRETERKRLNELSAKVIGLCIEVHRETGAGLLESAYEECLAYELRRNGLRFERQKEMPLRYKDVLLDCGYRLDFLIEDSLIIELKAVDKVLPIHQAQLLTYLKLSQKTLGLLINFNVPMLKDGIERMTTGDLFREENKGRSDGWRLASLLWASIPCLFGWR